MEMILIKSEDATVTITLDNQIHFHYECGDANDVFLPSADLHFDDLRNNEGNKIYEHGFGVDNETAFYQFLADWNDLIKNRHGRVKIDQMYFLEDQYLEFTADRERLSMTWWSSSCSIQMDFDWENAIVLDEVTKNAEKIKNLDHDFWVIIGEGDSPGCYKRSA